LVAHLKYRDYGVVVLVRSTPYAVFALVETCGFVWVWGKCGLPVGGFIVNCLVFKWGVYWTELNLAGICWGFVVVNLVYLFGNGGEKLDFWVKLGVDF
jgi:hypothetical protein